MLIRFQAAGFADNVLDLRQVVMLLGRGKGDCRVEAGDSDDRSIEVVESFFIDDSRNFSGQASGPGVFVEEDDLVRPFHGLRDGWAVDGDEGAQIDDFYLDSFFAQDFCGFQGGVDHGGVGDHAEVAAFARNASLSNGDDVILLGDFFLDPTIEILVLEENAGIVVADGGFDEAFGVVRRSRADDLEPGVVNEPHLGVLRVERAPVDVSAAGAAEDERGGRSPQVVGLGNHVGNLVHGAGDEVHELKFGDGAHTGERGSEGCAHDGRFSDGSIDDAFGAEAVDESVGDFERAAVNADVFAETENGGIALHFFPDSLADGFEVGELHRVWCLGFGQNPRPGRVSAAHRSLQMHGGFGCLVAARPLSYFGSSVLGFDFVTAVFAEDPAFGRFGRGHRGVHGDFAFCLDDLIDMRNQRFVFLAGQPLFVTQQVILKACNRVALFPEFKHFLRYVAGGVVNGVPFHAHHFGFNERWAFTAMRPFDGFMSGVVDLAGVGAVDNHARNAVSEGALGHVFATVLHVRGGRVGPQIRFDDEHEAEILNRREVDAFVGHSRGLTAVADISHDRNIASLQTRAERDARKNGNEIAEHGDGRDHVALLDVAEMRGAVAAPGGRIGLGHVLHHGVGGAKAADEKRSLVANHGREPVIFVERVGRSAGAGFLTESEIDAADHLALLVQILQRNLHFAVQPHVSVDLDGLLPVEIPGVADGWEGSVEVSADLVADVLVAVGVFFDALENREFRSLGAVVRNGVGTQIGVGASLRLAPTGARGRRHPAVAVGVRPYPRSRGPRPMVGPTFVGVVFGLLIIVAHSGCAEGAMY